MKKSQHRHSDRRQRKVMANRNRNIAWLSARIADSLRQYIDQSAPLPQGMYFEVVDDMRKSIMSINY